jgi:hypothetical protein
MKVTDVEQFLPLNAIVPERGAGESAVVVMRDGSFRAYIKVGNTNFGLKSKPERDAILYAWGSLIDSLEIDCPIQICVHSRQLDIEAYERQFERFIDDPQMPPQLRALASADLEFFASRVKRERLLRRDTYIVVPLKGTPKATQESMSDQFPFASLWRGLFGKVEQRLLGTIPTDEEIISAQNILRVRVQELVGRFEQCGLTAEAVGQSELMQVFYERYHADQSERQPVGAAALGFIGALPEIEAAPTRTRRALPAAPVDDTDWAS